MKANFVILLTVIYFFVGCKKEEKVPIFQPGDMAYGRMDAKKNGKNWVASSAAYYNEINPLVFGIIAVTVSDEGFIREQMVFNKIPMALGKHELTILNNDMFDGLVGASYNTAEDDGVTEDRWNVDEVATDNYIEITLIDTVANKVQGNFTVSFNIATDGGKRNPDNPDKVKFSKGIFDVEFFQ
jgi:hypothetical protein